MSSTALAKSAGTPEDRLVQAIKRFEAQLSPDQQKIYAKNQASNIRPGTSDVSKLLGEVDRLVKAKHGSRHAFKPRLESVVIAIQKFAAVGDVMVGGSQNLVASGVWSIARMALTAATSSLSTIEELSSLFMGAGSSAPYHEELALLYPQSDRIRTWICEYHIVVVEICRQLLIAVSKSMIGKLRFAFSDQNYRAQLERWGSAISREIQLSMAKSLDKQASETSRFRSNVLQKFTEDKHSRQMKARFRLLKACSVYEYRSSLQHLQKIGTAEFFLSEPAYLDWRAKKKESTLLISGKLGAGKSVLTSSIIEDLTINARDSTVCYFFCRHDIPQSLNARTIMGALCRQILESIVDLRVWERLLVSYLLPLNVEAMKSMILRGLPPGADICLIVDGLDECEQTEQEILLGLLKFFQKNLGCRVCVSYRTQPYLPFWTSGWSHPYHLSIPENNPDIQGHIRLELARRLENGTLKLNDPTLIEEIYTTLRDESDGMFLWAALQMDCICYEETDERIRHSLKRLPKTLPELYARILSRAAEGDIYHDQDRAFRLILAAFRLLKKDELGDALSVVPGDTVYDPKRHVHDINRLLARCASLIIIDEEYQTVQLIHQSARAYLMTDHVPADGISMNKDSIYRVMADTVVTYLRYGVFDRQISTNVITPISAKAIQEKVIGSVLGTSTRNLVALRLLHKISTADFNLGPSLDVYKTTTDTKSDDGQVSFPFSTYAENHFAIHGLVYNLDESTRGKSLLHEVLARKEHITLEIITTRSRFTWDSCDLNDLAMAGLQTSGTFQDFETLILIQDQNQQCLIEWCLHNNQERLADRLWTRYITRYPGSEMDCYNHKEAKKFCKWFCLAVQKTYYKVASVMFSRSLWKQLLESNPCGLAFAGELENLWMNGHHEAVK